MTRRATPQPGVDRMVSTSWSGRRWSSPAARQGRALARGLEGRLPLQHHYVRDQNSSSSRCRAHFSLALKRGIYREPRPVAAVPDQTRTGEEQWKAAVGASAECAISRSTLQFFALANAPEVRSLAGRGQGPDLLPDEARRRDRAAPTQPGTASRPRSRSRIRGWCGRWRIFLRPRCCGSPCAPIRPAGGASRRAFRRPADRT